MRSSARIARPFFRVRLSLGRTLAARVQPADTLDRSERLLARCRSELFEALDDAAARPKWAWRAFLTPWRWLGGFRHAFVFHPGWSAAALLLAGALAGTAAREWYRQIALPVPGNPVITVSAPAPITEQELETIESRRRFASSHKAVRLILKSNCKSRSPAAARRPGNAR